MPQRETDTSKRSRVGEADKVPQTRKGMLPKMLWMVLAFAVVWWLGSGSGETTVFRRVVAVLFGWQMDLVLEVLGAAAAILLGITIVFLKSQVMTVPRMKSLTDPAVRMRAPSPRDIPEAELQSLGFRFIGDFEAAMSTATSMRIRAYAGPDGLHGAVLMDAKSGSERATVLEFSTRLQPSGSIVTNTSPYPVVSSYPLNKCICRVPWKKTASEVMALHEALCRTAREEKFRPESFSTVDFAEEVINATRKDMEYQVETGRYRKIAEDQYRQSLWGIAVAVPRIWLNMTYSFLFSWYRPPAGFFRWRVRRRLRKFRLQIEENDELAKSDAEDGETPEGVSRPLSAKEREAPSVKM